MTDISPNATAVLQSLITVAGWVFAPSAVAAIICGALNRSDEIELEKEKIELEKDKIKYSR